MDRLTRSETTSVCPFKGTAHYYSLRVGAHALKDSVWTYDEHAALKDRVAFYDDKMPRIHVNVE